MSQRNLRSSDLGGEFEVLRVLGRGVRATVYLAREVALRRLVAIKLLSPALAGDSVVRQRFEREARAAARLVHPNIVAIHRVSALPDGTPYFVMEYVEGQNLADAAAAGVIDHPTTYVILTQLADALAFAHDQGIVHRDVQPSNVIWNASTHRAVLTDFGIAAVLETGSEVVTRLTRAGEVLGMPRYASPEQLSGQALTGAADVYSLAILGYELIAGEGPFEPISPSDFDPEEFRANPRPLSRLAPDADRRVAAVLERCLARKPERRPPPADVCKRVASAVDRNSPAHGALSNLFTTPMLDSAAEHLPPFQRFIDELRQRRVFNVGLAYAALIVIVLEGASLILPELPLPAWSYTAVVALTLAGFPVALVLAWSYDLTAEGIRRSASPVQAERSIRLLRYGGLAMSLVVAVLIGWWILRF